MWVTHECLKHTRPQGRINLQAVRRKPKQAPKLRQKQSEFSQEPEMFHYSASEKGNHHKSSAQRMQPMRLTEKLSRDDLGPGDKKHILKSLRLEAYEIEVVLPVTQVPLQMG